MMEKARIYLLTRADDVGSNRSANLATLEAYQKGILRNASFMAPCVGFKEGVEMLKKEKGLCCGMHITMNAEWDAVKWGPVLPPEKVPSLVDENGLFFQTTQLLHDHNPRLEEILEEMQAQLDLARKLGLDVKYADAHMGFTWVLDGLADEFGRWCQRNGIINPRSFYANRLPKAEGTDPVERLIASLKMADPGTYLIVGHPAYDNEEMRALEHPGYPSEEVAVGRDWQRRIFTDPRIVEYCRESGVMPMRFDEVPKAV